MVFLFGSVGDVDLNLQLQASTAIHDIPFDELLPISAMQPDGDGGPLRDDAHGLPNAPDQ